MPICKICNKLIKPLGMPVDLVEQMGVFLTKIVDDVYYETSDDCYKHKAHYPVPAVPLLVNWITTPSLEGVVVWKEPCTLVKKWTCHAPKYRRWPRQWKG